MSYTESIVFAFSPFGKSTESTIFSVGMEIVSSSSKYLVAIGLVAYVPDQLVIRGIVNIVKGYRKFNNTKTGCKMTAMHTDHVHNVLPQFITNFVKFILPYFF